MCGRRYAYESYDSEKEFPYFAGWRPRVPCNCSLYLGFEFPLSFKVITNKIPCNAAYFACQDSSNGRFFKFKVILCSRSQHKQETGDVAYFARRFCSRKRVFQILFSLDIFLISQLELWTLYSGDKPGIHANCSCFVYFYDLFLGGKAGVCFRFHNTVYARGALTQGNEVHLLTLVL